MFDLYFNNMIKHFLAVATSAIVYFPYDKNKYIIPMHIDYVVCFFIISSLVAVIVNLVGVNEIFCVAIIVMLLVNNKLNRLKILNKIME